MPTSKFKKTIKRKTKKAVQKRVSTLRKYKNVDIIAIFLADIHLQEQAPILRCEEDDWYAAMARPLKEVREMANRYKCPVICAGDVFDHWKASPELINFAIEHLPKMYSIPGQHDLPYHNLEKINQSAYKTLEHAGIITNIDSDKTEYVHGMALHGFPFGRKIHQEGDMDDEYIHIAILHEYTWIDGYGYTTAPKKQRVTKARTNANNSKYGTYDVVVTGDNHRGFMTEVGTTTLFNCGSLMQRHKNELEYRPQVGLLTRHGDVIPYHINIHDDKYLDQSDIDMLDGLDIDMSAFFESLEKLDKVGLDFTEAVYHYIKTNRPKKNVKEILIAALEENE